MDREIHYQTVKQFKDNCAEFNNYTSWDYFLKSFASHHRGDFYTRYIPIKPAYIKLRRRETKLIKKVLKPLSVTNSEAVEREIFSTLFDLEKTVVILTNNKRYLCIRAKQ